MQDEATYGHLGSQSILMELKDILKAKQLSLTFSVILDTLEIPRSTLGLMMGLESRVEFPTSSGY